MVNSTRRNRGESLFGSLGYLPGLGNSEANTSALVMDVVQAKFLQSFFTQALERQLSRNTKEFVFLKGGKALGLMGIVDRKTKDLDFNVDPILDVSTMNRMMERASIEVSRLGILNKFEWKPVANNGGHDIGHKWRIEGFLNNGSKFQMYVECTRRNAMPEGSHHTVDVNLSSLGVPAFKAEMMTPMAIAASKMTAILDRKNPRDILDLYILVTKVNVEPPVQFLALMGANSLHVLLDQVDTYRDSASWLAYKESVLPYVSHSLHEEYGTEDKFNEMRDLVFDVARDWLTQAVALVKDLETEPDLVGDDNAKQGIRI